MVDAIEGAALQVVLHACASTMLVIFAPAQAASGPRGEACIGRRGWACAVGRERKRVHYPR